jgi:RNA polymerase sigma-70 factor (ECF subfamily)
MIDLDVHLSAIAAGDPEAFARWVAGAEPALRSSLRPLAAHVDCEAVLQEALLRVWQVAPRCTSDGRPNGLVRLGARIARNLALDELRRVRAVVVDVGELESALAEGGAGDVRPSDPLLRRAIEECQRALPAQPAAALRARLHAAGAEPDARLAEQLHMRLNTFLQNVGRARKLLAACLHRRGIELGELT